MVLFILYCYNVYHGIEGRGLYQNFIIPFPSFVSSDQQIMIVNKLIEYHEYIGLPTTCSIISDVPCFENGSSNGTIGLNFVWLLVTAAYFSIWLNAIHKFSTWYKISIQLNVKFQKMITAYGPQSAALDTSVL